MVQACANPCRVWNLLGEPRRNMGEIVAKAYLLVSGSLFLLQGIRDDCRDCIEKW